MYCFDDMNEVRSKRNSSSNEKPGYNSTTTKRLIGVRGQSQSSTKGINMENRVNSTGMLGAKKQEKLRQRPLKTSRHILAEKNATDGSNDNVSDSNNKTVRKIYSSRKEKRNKKNGSLKSNRIASRSSSKSKNMKTSTIVTGCSKKVNVEKPQNLKTNSAADHNTYNRKMQDRHNVMSNGSKLSAPVRNANDLLEDRDLAEEKSENQCAKPSIEDSREMPSLIQNDTETDSASLVQTSIDGKTLTEMSVANEGHGEEESGNSIERRFYDGIYFLGEQANNVLSYVFSNENPVEPEDTMLINGEPSRSEF